MKNYEINVTINIDGEDADEGYYIIIKGQRVPCTKEVYLAFKRPIRSEAMRKYRDQKPFINGKRCQGDCNKCIHHEWGFCDYTGALSLDALYEDDGIEPEAAGHLEDDACNNVLLEQMRAVLEEEDDVYMKIFELMLEEKTQRDIANDLGIVQGTVSYYIKKIRKMLEKFR